MEKFISIEDAAKSLYLDTASLIRKSVEDNLSLVVNMDENPSRLPINFHFRNQRELASMVGRKPIKSRRSFNVNKFLWNSTTNSRKCIIL